MVVLTSWWRVSEHFAVEELSGAQRLVLGGGGHVAIDGQRCEEPRDLGRSHPDGMALAVEDDVAADPGDIGLLGAPAIVAGAEGLSHPIEESRPGCSGRAAFSDQEIAPRAPPDVAPYSNGLLDRRECMFEHLCVWRLRIAGSSRTGKVNQRADGSTTWLSKLRYARASRR